jgi:cytochrome c peroxidase
MFWDGRAPSLEGQALGPMVNPVEMGAAHHKEVVERLGAIPGYKERFERVFGTNVTLDGVAKAIATFERVAALSGNSKYDKYNAGDNAALTESEKRGMVLFGLRLNTDDEFKPGVELQKGMHHLPRRRELQRRAIPQPGRRLRRRREQIQGHGPLGCGTHRRQERP